MMSQLEMHPIIINYVNLNVMMANDLAQMCTDMQQSWYSAGERASNGHHLALRKKSESMLFVEAGVGRPSRWRQFRLVKPLIFSRSSKYPLRKHHHLCSTMRMPRVTVILSDEEYAQAKREAGLIPLSAWFRSKVVEGSDAKAVRRDGPVRLAERGTSAPERPEHHPRCACLICTGKRKG